MRNISHNFTIAPTLKNSSVSARKPLTISKKRCEKYIRNYLDSLHDLGLLDFLRIPPTPTTPSTMPQILDPVPQDHSDRLTCTYLNYTSQIQVVRITDIKNWYFERVVFPGQRLLFVAPGEAHLEIHTGMMASAILSDTLACRDLAIPDNVPPALRSDTLVA